MAAWYGYPYDRLPERLKTPARWAIIGGVIGVAVGALTGLNPVGFGLGLIAIGAALGALALTEKNRSDTMSVD